MKLASVPETFPLEISYKSCRAGKESGSGAFQAWMGCPLAPPRPRRELYARFHPLFIFMSIGRSIAKIGKLTTSLSPHQVHAKKECEVSYASSFLNQ